MNIIFTDYTKEKLEKLKKYEIISHLLFVFLPF